MTQRTWSTQRKSANQKELRPQNSKPSAGGSKKETQKLGALGHPTRKQIEVQAWSLILLHCDQQSPRLATRACRFINSMGGISRTSVHGGTGRRRMIREFVWINFYRKVVRFSIRWCNDMLHLFPLYLLQCTAIEIYFRALRNGKQKRQEVAIRHTY